MFLLIQLCKGMTMICHLNEASESSAKLNVEKDSQEPMKNNSHIKWDKGYFILKENSDHGLEAQTEVSPYLFQSGNRLMKFYTDRTKKIIS